MKRTITLVAALVIVIGSAFASGNEKSTANTSTMAKVFETNDDVFRVIYPGKEKGMVKVAIKDESGKTVNSEKIRNKDGFARTYDLSQLKEGQYSISVQQDDQKFEQDIEVKDEANLSLIQIGNDFYKLNADFRTKSDLYVNIYNQDQELIHNEKIENTSEFSRSYNLTQVASEEYTFEVVGWGTSKKLDIK